MVLLETEAEWPPSSTLHFRWFSRAVKYPSLGFHFKPRQQALALRPTLPFLKGPLLLAPKSPAGAAVAACNLDARGAVSCPSAGSGPWAA
jgi:hypothetical protein